MEFKDFWNILPEEIVINNLHYNLWITPYDVSYMSFNGDKQYQLLISESMDLTISDKYERLVDCCWKMYCNILGKYI